MERAMQYIDAGLQSAHITKFFRSSIKDVYCGAVLRAYGTREEILDMLEK